MIEDRMFSRQLEVQRKKFRTQVDYSGTFEGGKDLRYSYSKVRVEIEVRSRSGIRTIQVIKC